MPFLFPCDTRTVLKVLYTAEVSIRQARRTFPHVPAVPLNVSLT